MTSQRIASMAGRELATQTTYRERAVAGSALSQTKRKRRKGKRGYKR